MSFNRLKIIQNQLKMLMRSGNPYVTVDYEKFKETYLESGDSFDNEDIQLFFTMTGVEGTPWEGIEYTCRLSFLKNYPIKAPNAEFITKIAHPNVYKSGNICISILHDGEDGFNSGEAGMRWTPQQTLESIMMSIHALFEDPYCGSPASVDASKLYQNNRQKLRELNLSYVS